MSMDWFLYDRYLRHEKVKKIAGFLEQLFLQNWKAHQILMSLSNIYHGAFSESS